MEIRLSSLLWISTFTSLYGQISSTTEGIDIGYNCKRDAQCVAGNGGEYSKCHQDLGICICTINHIGEDKCMPDSDRYDRFCRRHKLYDTPGQCTLECSPKGTRKWRENEDWYGEINEYFANSVADKKTSVCYDPLRAVHTVPDVYEIKRSIIPNAGLGIFTRVFIKRDTIFGPYKGIKEFDTDYALLSGYSWKVEPIDGEDRGGVIWEDAKDISLSNWLRYSNTPITADMENLVAIQFKGHIYYQAFKNILPGTELTVWYGDSYGEFLEIEKFDPPRYYYSKPGYVGGACHEDDEGTSCQYDDNTVCADKTCLCVPGTSIRAGLCVTDETMGGVCTGENGESCKKDTHAECQRGVCVCKNNSTPANGRCRLDETFGGYCAGRDGDVCLVDSKAICIQSLCTCKYGTTGIDGKCVTDEVYQGRCIGEDGDECTNDSNAICMNKMCVCVDNATVIDGKCELDEAAGGVCKAAEGEPCAIDEFALCMNGICVCKPGTSNIDGFCYFDEVLGGRCRSEDGVKCKKDNQSICKAGICSCKEGKSNIDGLCISDGALSGVCVDGKCNGKNVICDTNSQTCVCPPKHLAYAGKCVKERNSR